MTNPKVSIVIPVYNGSNYLKEAIDSALAQTYKNIEIIVVNDGSNDNGATEEIAKSYGNKIKYYSKKNGGVASALNLGIKKMTGDYFSWLSHDDLYYPDKVERQVKYLANIGCRKVFLYSNYAILRGSKITPVIHNHEMLTRKSEYSLLRGCVNGITTLIPKDIFTELGPINESLRCTQDYDYWRKVQKKYPFVHMDEVLSITRLHESQDSVASPSAIEEGNVLWIDMIESLPAKSKRRLEGTLYNFYLEMVKFLETAPYPEALNYCRRELAKAEEAHDTSEQTLPKVSVIIPFFNRVEKTIAAVRSVLEQKYENVEVILVDDCSTDDINKIKKIAARDKRLRLLKMPQNAGPAAARNYGIRESIGEYIAFLDSDDIFLPAKLSTQMRQMLLRNPTISYTSYIRRIEGQEDVEVKDPGLTGLVVPRIVSNCTIATPTVVVKKEFLVDNKLSFDENMRVGEDTCLWLDIAKHTDIHLVDEPLTVVHVDEHTHNRNSDTLLMGIRNILLYLLQDGYYAQFMQEISLICAQYKETVDAVQAAQMDRVLNGGPIVSTEDEDIEIDDKRRPVGRLKRSLPYKAARRVYRGTRKRINGVVKREREE